MTTPATPFSISSPIFSGRAFPLLGAHVLAEDAVHLLGLEVADVGELGNGAVELTRGEGGDDRAGAVVEPRGDRAARAEEFYHRLFRIVGEFLLGDLVVRLALAVRDHRFDRADGQADVIAGVELEHDVVVIGGLGPGEDDPPEITACRVDLDVEPDAGFELLEALQRVAHVSLVDIVAHVNLP